MLFFVIDTDLILLSMKDCKSLEMKNINDRFDVHDFAMKEDDLNKCVKELKHKCDPLTDVKPCWPLHDYFNEEDDKQEAVCLKCYAHVIFVCGEIGVFAVFPRVLLCVWYSLTCHA